MGLRGSGFLAPLVRGTHRVHGALDGDAGDGGLRLPEHRLGLPGRDDSDAASAAHGAARRVPRGGGGPDAAAHRPRHCHAHDGHQLRRPRRARVEREARRLADHARLLRQWHRLGGRQPGAPRRHRRGGRGRAHGHGHVARCGRQQRQPDAWADGGRADARRRRNRRRVHGERVALRDRAGDDADATLSKHASRLQPDRGASPYRRGPRRRSPGQADGRHAHRHDHLQRVRLAIHQHGAGDRAGQPASQ